LFFHPLLASLQLATMDDFPSDVQWLLSEAIVSNASNFTQQSHCARHSGLARFVMDTANAAQLAEHACLIAKANGSKSKTSDDASEFLAADAAPGRVLGGSIFRLR
jgi:hypothetical protein